MPGHNSSLFVLGVMILWFGWYGFNPGSQLALVGYSGAIANAAITTTLAPAFASLSALAVRSTLTRFSTGELSTCPGRLMAGLAHLSSWVAWHTSRMWPRQHSRACCTCQRSFF